MISCYRNFLLFSGLIRVHRHQPPFRHPNLIYSRSTVSSELTIALLNCFHIDKCTLYRSKISPTGNFSHVHCIDNTMFMLRTTLFFTFEILKSVYIRSYNISNNNQIVLIYMLWAYSTFCFLDLEDFYYLGSKHKKSH